MIKNIKTCKQNELFENFLEKFCVKAKNKSIDTGIDTHKKVDTGEKKYFFDIFFFNTRVNIYMSQPKNIQAIFFAQPCELFRPLIHPGTFKTHQYF